MMTLAVSPCQELNRLRSRSVCRRSAPLEGPLEVSLSRMRSRSAHREGDRPGWVSAVCVCVCVCVFCF